MSYLHSLLDKLKRNKKKVIVSAAAFTFFAAWIINNIKKSGPHNTTLNILSGGFIQSPNVKTGGSKIDNKQFNDLKSALKDYIQNGQDIGTQISVFIKNKEQFNYYAVDKNRFPNYNQSSLHTIFSSTKNISALLIAIAVNNKWINSYDDNIHKYWPEFPTKSQFFKVTKDEKGRRKLIFEDCETDTFLTISDILRHEGGLDRLWGADKILYIKQSGLDDVKKYIEASSLCYRKYNDNDKVPDSNRFYHALMRGLILNELFRRTEPKHRSMNQYFKEEIVPILVKNDSEFKMYLKGKSMSDRSKVYHIENSNILWILYHIIAPFIFGTGHLPKKHYFNKYLNVDIKYSNFKRMKKLSDLNRITTKENNYAPDWTRFRKIKTISKQFEYENKVKMEWMSATGISNAHSMSKLLSYFLFNDNTNITKNFSETVNEMISEPKKAYDATILSISQFTKGGFNKVTLYDITWYLWGGLGGSWYAFSPKYECTFAYTVIGFNRLDLNMCCSETEQHVGKEPRGNVVFYYLSKYLKSLS